MISKLSQPISQAAFDFIIISREGTFIIFLDKVFPWISEANSTSHLIVFQ
jgi:hypothetical protein